MDINAVQAIMGSLKAANDISKALFDLKITAEVQSKVIDIKEPYLLRKTASWRQRIRSSLFKSECESWSLS